jgi:predicted nuclease of restriction endonuclease-like RecB superfamily
MLSPEHVRVRRRGQELRLLPLEGALRERAVALATELVACAREHVGRTRDELQSAWSAIEVAPKERRLLAGLAKLVEDRSEFEVLEGADPAQLRSEVFLLAAERRCESEAGFERAAVLAEVAARHGLDPAALEGLLYADLRGAHRLVSTAPPPPLELVESYDRAQVQAVLLRAVRVTADVRAAGADAYRDLFRQLKFRRLLHHIEPLADGGYRIQIDGPFSLFQSVAKYGLELALMLPALESVGSLDLVAEVRWSDRGRALAFRYRAERAGGAAVTGLRSEVEELLADLGEFSPAWRARAADVVLNLPGVGVCVPDLVLERASDATSVFVEVLGFWSRESVWRRIELAQKGLRAPILFVVSSRLRVSEDVLEDSEHAALYVYKGRINARALLRKVEALGGRAPRAS